MDGGVLSGAVPVDTVAQDPLLSRDAPGPRPVDLPARIQYLDGLRGLAVLLVLICHAWGYAIYRPGSHFVNSPLDPIVINLGYDGVTLFLVLSGFCLSYPLWRRRLAGDAHWFRASHFFARRALRILPPYYVALLLTYVLIRLCYRSHILQGLGPTPTRGNLLTHLLLIHNLTKYNTGISDQFWSLGLEWQWYFVFPLLLLACVYRPRWTAVVCALVAVLWGICIFRLVLDSSGAGGVSFLHNLTVRETLLAWLNAVPARLIEFCGGILAARFAAERRSLSKRWVLVLVPLIPLGLVVANVTILSAQWIGYPLRAVFHAIPFVCFVVLAGQLPRLNRLLSWRPIVLLGIASYGVYLAHDQVMRVAWLVSPSPLRASYLFVPVAILVGTAGGVLFHLAIERPVMRRSTWQRFGPTLTAIAGPADRVWEWITQHVPDRSIPTRDDPRSVPVLSSPGE
jgi:peptidoglycan/LPS O-acetylase OafA/YrhL